MRRLFPLGLLLLLPACNYVGSPVDGAGNFLGDTISFRTNPNRPAGDAPNMLRVMGVEAPAEPLLSEPGDVWPGPLPPAKTLSDLQREPNAAPAVVPGSGDTENIPGSGDAGSIPRPMPRGSSMGPIAPTQTVPALRMPPPPANQPTGAGSPSTRVIQTPAGPAITSVGGNGIETFTMPSGKTGMVINNGNGTATLVGSDGSTVIAPIPR
jgi:hypothetical protein